MVPIGGISMSAIADWKDSKAGKNRNKAARRTVLIGLLYRRNPKVDRVFRRPELRCLRFARGRREPSGMYLVEPVVGRLRCSHQLGVRPVGDIDPADVVV